jgi:protein SCO1/2
MDEQATPRSAGRRRLSRSTLLPLILLVVALATATVVLAIGGGGGKLPGGAKREAPGGGYRGGLVRPERPAPAISLRNYLGKPVTLASYRGKAVLVTFLYTHCPDVCPAITSALRVAQQELGPEASRVQIIAVSVDPHGDKPTSVATFLKLHHMTDHMQYLLGTPRQLARVWSAWNVGSQKDTTNPEFVAHTALVYGIGANGKLITVYPANFRPADIAHDVPKLAAA